MASEDADLEIKSGYLRVSGWEEIDSVYSMYSSFTVRENTLWGSGKTVQKWALQTI